MELNDYVEIARGKYPNGYSDYIAANPEDTMNAWYELYKAMNISKIVEGQTFDVNEIVLMENWTNEKFWLFIGDINREFDSNKTTKE
jgi:hypothetical protein